MNTVQNEDSQKAMIQMTFQHVRSTVHQQTQSILTKNVKYPNFAKKYTIQLGNNNANSTTKTMIIQQNRKQHNKFQDC